MRVVSKKIIWDSERLSRNVYELVDQTDALRDQQSLIFSQYSVLSGKTTELTEMAQNVLRDVNETMSDLKSTFSPEGRPSKNLYFCRSCVIWILERLLRCEF